MAGGQFSLTRRALLGAACAGPVEAVAARHPGGSRDLLETRSAPLRPEIPAFAGMTEKWQKALATLRRAEAALTAAEKGPEEVYDRLGARHERALQRLLLTPAPDVAALALKLDLVLYEGAEEFLGPAAAMKALKRDARRLALP